MCALAYVFLTSPVLAQADSDFARANQEYAQGHFKDAIAGYEGLVRTGQASANVFYDLGNAYFRTGDFGRAILNYQRALALERIILKRRRIYRSHAMRHTPLRCSQPGRSAICILRVSISTPSQQRSLFGSQCFV